MDKKSGIFTTTLVQQTPMIHFQSEEDGVCFRPSEAKPKLDRFLMYYFKRKGIQVRDEWFVDKALNNALKYKMQVKALGRPEVLELGNKDDKKAYDALFFGNMGAKESEKKKTIEYRNSNILLKIVCFDDTLMTHIQ